MDVYNKDLLYLGIMGYVHIAMVIETGMIILIRTGLITFMLIWEQMFALICLPAIGGKKLCLKCIWMVYFVFLSSWTQLCNPVATLLDFSFFVV